MNKNGIGFKGRWLRVGDDVLYRNTKNTIRKAKVVKIINRQQIYIEVFGEIISLLGNDCRRITWEQDVVFKLKNLDGDIVPVDIGDEILVQFLNKKVETQSRIIEDFGFYSEKIIAGSLIENITGNIYTPFGEILAYCVVKK